MSYFFSTISLQTLSSNQEGVCPSIVLGLHLEVLYSNVGALSNPQPKILGVKYTYDTGEVRYQVRTINYIFLWISMFQLVKRY